MIIRTQESIQKHLRLQMAFTVVQASLDLLESNDLYTTSDDDSDDGGASGDGDGTDEGDNMVE